MKTTFVGACAAIAALMALTACGGGEPKRAAEDTVDYVPPAEAERYQNHTHLGETDGTADPFVMRHNGKYYLYPTGYNGIRVYESEDLVHWTDKGYCVRSADVPAMKGNPWAPEVVYFGGYFYLCTSVSGEGHYILRAEEPTGPFVLASKTTGGDPSSPGYGNLGMGIDGDFYVSDEGKLYLLHTGNNTLAYNELEDVQNLCAETVGMGETIPARSATLNGWIEGAATFRRGDFTYLTYTGNDFRGKGYRVAYSYAENFTDFSGFTQPTDSVTLIDTDDGHFGLGHSCNVAGPDLDAVYTVYHDLIYPDRAMRYYNVDRYLASGSILTANGVTHRPVLVPSKPAAGGYAEALQEQNGAYVIGTAENFFTAEYNFVPSEGQELLCGIYRIRVGNGKVSLLKNGNVVGEKEVSIPEGRLAVVRVENGDGVGHVYFNNMRLISYEAEEGGGLIGYTKNENVGYTAFTNDVFGTSDFEAPKNFPTKFPATDYLKGEGRGFGIAGSKRVKGGVRVGEKESIRRVDDANAVVLESGDWVKYAVDVEKDESFAVFAEVTRASEGAQLRFTNGTNLLEATIPELGEGESKTVRVYLGTLKLAGGISSMKLEVLSGKAEITLLGAENIETGAVSLQNYTVLSGEVTEDGGLRFAPEASPSAAVWQNTLGADFTARITFTAEKGSSFGFMFREKYYSYNTNQPAQSWQGYEAALDGGYMELSRCDYGNNGFYRSAKLGGVNVADGNAHTLELKARGHVLEATLDGSLTLTATDPCAFPVGRLGLVVRRGAVLVTQLVYTA